MTPVVCMNKYIVHLHTLTLVLKYLLLYKNMYLY